MPAAWAWWPETDLQLAAALVSAGVYVFLVVRAMAKNNRRARPDRSPIWLWLALVAPVWIVLTALVIGVLAPWYH